jgi:hypothetical protein
MINLEDLMGAPEATRERLFKILRAYFAMQDALEAIQEKALAQTSDQAWVEVENIASDALFQAES